MKTVKALTEHFYYTETQEIIIRHMIIPTDLLGIKSLERFIVHRRDCDDDLLSFIKEDVVNSTSNLVNDVSDLYELDRLHMETNRKGEECIGWETYPSKAIKENFSNYFDHSQNDWSEIAPMIMGHFDQIGCTSDKHPLFWAKKLFMDGSKRILQPATHLTILP